MSPGVVGAKLAGVGAVVGVVVAIVGSRRSLSSPIAIPPVDLPRQRQHSQCLEGLARSTVRTASSWLMKHFWMSRPTKTQKRMVGVCIRARMKPAISGWRKKKKRKKGPNGAESAELGGVRGESWAGHERVVEWVME